MATCGSRSGGSDGAIRLKNATFSSSVASQTSSGLRDDAIEEHHAVDRLPCGDRTTIAALGLADGAIERLMMDVIERRAVVQTVAGGRVAALDELVEKLGHVVPVRRAGEGRVLARHTDAGVQHDRDQEPRLALREAEFRDGLDAILSRHFKNSSARPPLRPPPRRPLPFPPPIRALKPL